MQQVVSLADDGYEDFIMFFFHNSYRLSIAFMYNSRVSSQGCGLGTRFRGFHQSKPGKFVCFTWVQRIYLSMAGCLLGDLDSSFSK